MASNDTPEVMSQSLTSPRPTDAKIIPSGLKATALIWWCDPRQKERAEEFSAFQMVTVPESSPAAKSQPLPGRAAPSGRRMSGPNERAVIVARSLRCENKTLASESVAMLTAPSFDDRAINNPSGEKARAGVYSS